MKTGVRDQKRTFRHQKRLISKDQNNLLGIKQNLILIDLLLKMKTRGSKKTYSFRTFARSGTDFVAGAALSKGRRNAFAGQVQISRQAQRFRKVRYRFRGRRSTFARCGPDFVAGTILSEGQVQISQQAQHFSKVRDRFAAGAMLSQGAVQISRQAQLFRKRCQFRGRRSTFAMYGAEFDAGAALNQRGGLGGGRQPPP